MLNNPRGPKGLSIARRLNLQSQSGEAGNRKTNRAEVQLFKQRLRDGLSRDEARAGLKISRSSANDIAAGRTWSSVVIMALMCVVLTGSSCQDSDTVVCQGLNYPYCADVPASYPCLCLSAPYGVPRATSERMRYLNEN